MDTIAPSFLIGSSSNLVTRTVIESRTSLNSGHIRLVKCCGSNLNISEASRPILIKLYMKHHLGRGKAAQDFGADWIKTLVSTATKSSHRLIMGGKCCGHDIAFIFDRIFFNLAVYLLLLDTKLPPFFIISSSNLQVDRPVIESRMRWISGHIRPLTSELPVFERRKKCCGHDSAFSFDRIFESNL